MSRTGYIVLSRAQNFCIYRCKQKRLRILWYLVLAKNETNGAKYYETFKIHAYFIADFPRLNFLYHICIKKVFFTNSRQLFLSFGGADRINQLSWALATKLFLFSLTLFDFYVPYSLQFFVLFGRNTSLLPQSCNLMSIVIINVADVYTQNFLAEETFISHGSFSRNVRRYLCYVLNRVYMIMGY